VVILYVRVTRRRCYGVRVPEIGKVGEGVRGWVGTVIAGFWGFFKEEMCEILDGVFWWWSFDFV